MQWLGQDVNPAYLSNPRLQAKPVLVAILTLNAFALHQRAFPLLGKGRPVSAWMRAQWLGLAGRVAISGSLWFCCAFLGVARPWNGTVPVGFVLGMAAVVWQLKRRFMPRLRWDALLRQEGYCGIAPRLRDQKLTP